MRRKSSEDFGLSNHNAQATPATARRPTATDPTFLVAAPVKDEPGPVAVPDAVAGAIGEPVAEGPEPPAPLPGEPAPDALPDEPLPDPLPDEPLPDPLPDEPAPEVPVGTAAVPVAKPVEPASADELKV